MNTLKNFLDLIDSGTDIVSAYFICKEQTVILAKKAITQEEKEDAAAQGLMLMLWLAYYSLDATEEERTIINNILYPFNLLSKILMVYAKSTFVLYAYEKDVNKRYEKSIKFNDVAFEQIQSISHLLEEKNND